MKTVFRIFVLIILALCIGYYLGFDFKTPIDAILGKTQATFKNDTSLRDGQAVIPEKSDKNEADKKAEIVTNTENRVVDGLISFIKFQKDGNKLIRSYRTDDKGYKDMSYIYDDALAVIALVNRDKDRSYAADILKNMAALQNKDGSWYEVYDVSGQTFKTSGKTNTTINTANIALLLYSYSYYTNVVNDRQFMDVMKKCADYLLSKRDEKGQSVYDSEVSSKGTRSLKANAYTYFSLREYAICCFNDNYKEFKDKLFAAQSIASWTINNLLDKGAFVKEYAGSSKSNVVDLDSQVAGCLLLKASGADSKKYEIKDLKASLSKLYKKTDDIEGYKMDDSSKNNGFIWCRGTCSVPLAFIKLGYGEGAEIEIQKIENAYDNSQDDENIKGIKLSTNSNSKIDVPNFESSGSCSWGVISLQCFDDEEISKICFGKEEEVLRNTTKNTK